jgi:hypothetical protein
VRIIVEREIYTWRNTGIKRDFQVREVEMSSGSVAFLSP